MADRKSIVIYGAGSVGSALAMAFSHRKDLDVTAVGRKAHVERIQASGLKVGGIVEETVHFNAVEKVTSSLSDTLVIVAVKAVDLHLALQDIRPFLQPSSVLLLVQNGYNIRSLALGELEDAVPADQVLTGIVGMGVTLIGPGHIHFWGGNVRLDSRFSHTPFADIFEDTPVAGRISKDIERDAWRKLVVNSIVNPLSVLLQTSNRFLADSRIDELKKMLLEEGLSVSSAAGYPLKMDIDFLNRFIENDNFTSMYQDISRNRKTEVDFINGGIIECAKKTGVPVPVNRFVLHLIHAIESAHQEGHFKPFPV